ncbi:MAG: NUDIX domain-containing protein [Anaerolineae bacterium]|nr:NUDIX domain-containing protein [Anaerolineae bacterium]
MTNQAHSTQWPPKIAVCVGTVVLQGDRVLLVRQAEGHPLAGQWSIPWGLVDADEAPEAAALRETQEEAGIQAEIEGLLGLQNLSTDGWIALIFLCRHAAGEPTDDGGVETDAAGYFSLEEMEKLGEPIETWCAWLVRRVLAGDYTLVPPQPHNPYHPRLAFF